MEGETAMEVKREFFENFVAYSNNTNSLTALWHLPKDMK